MDEYDLKFLPSLLPCKKCGHPYGRLIVYGHIDGRPYTYRITCPNCSYCTKEKEYQYQAYGAWNQRG